MKKKSYIVIPGSEQVRSGPMQPTLTKKTTAEKNISRIQIFSLLGTPFDLHG